MLITLNKQMVLDKEVFWYIKSAVSNLVRQYRDLAVTIDSDDYGQLQNEFIANLVMDGYRYRKLKGRI